MKKIILFDEYNEGDLKPSELLHKYIQLTEEDVKKYFIDKGQLKDVPCPGCKSEETVPAFQKFGMNYVECKQCHTLYITPRPDDNSLMEYYTQAAARKFWEGEFLSFTKTMREEKMIKPRMQWIVESTQEYMPDAGHIVDINANQYGYIEELIKTGLFRKKTFVNPYFFFDSLKDNPDINIISSPLREVRLNDVDVVISFEVANQVADMELLFEKMYGMLKNDGLCFMTVTLISGFDLQILWDKAENIFPPDRLNVLSVEGLFSLFKRHNFECIEFSTPGILDVELVMKAIRKDPEVQVPRFIKYMMLNRNEEIKRSFQAFLQEGLLSSYARILLRKR